MNLITVSDARLITKMLFCYANLMIFATVSGDKASDGDTDHLPGSRAEVKNAYQCTSIYLCMLIKHRDIFTFLQF